jgi:hypothetical protein
MNPAPALDPAVFVLDQDANKKLFFSSFLFSKIKKSQRSHKTGYFSYFGLIFFRAGVCWPLLC